MPGQHVGLHELKRVAEMRGPVDVWNRRADENTFVAHRNLLGTGAPTAATNRGPDFGTSLLTSSWQRELAPLARHHLRAQPCRHKFRIQRQTALTGPAAPVNDAAARQAAGRISRTGTAGPTTQAGSRVNSGGSRPGGAPADELASPGRRGRA